jgi:hypothetical protein
VFDVRRHRDDDGASRLVLQRKQLVEAAVVALTPDLLAADRVNQCSGDAHLLGRAAHAALEHVAHAQFACHRARVHRTALVSLHAVA